MNSAGVQTLQQSGPFGRSCFWLLQNEPTGRVCTSPRVLRLCYLVQVAVELPRWPRSTLLPGRRPGRRLQVLALVRSVRQQMHALSAQLHLWRGQVTGLHDGNVALAREIDVLVTDE